MEFGPLLKRQRRRRRLTQEELAERTGYSVSYISMLERGVRRAPPETVVLMADALNLAEDERREFEGAGSDGPPRSAGAPSAADLPLPLTTFIGREREITDVRRSLLAARLVTLVGMGGVGKTRLALEVARDLGDEYSGGVRLAELAPLTDGTMVPTTVALAIETSERPDRPLRDSLADSIGADRVLLLLDNCEHVIEAVRNLAKFLLQRCPNLTILATSRESLHVAGEVIRVISPLSAPGLGDTADITRLGRYDAVALFVERARRVQPHFALNAQTGPHVAHICRQLEGLPLGVELAAARVAVVSVDQISRRLDDAARRGSRLLMTRDPSAPGRHQSLQAALDWSYQLLSPDEQRLLLRMAVFVGGWSLEAAEVINHDPEGAGSDVLDSLAQLLEKSLITVHIRSDGAYRYRMLEPVRQYAYEYLVERGERDEVHRRQAILLLQLVEAARTGLVGPDQTTWLTRIEAEHENLSAALAWCEQSSPTLGYKLIAYLWFPWYMQGHYREGRNWLERMIRLDPEVPDSIRIFALRGLGAMAFAQGDYARAELPLQNALQLCRELNDDVQASRVLNQLAIIAKNRGEFERSIAWHEESLSLKRKVGDQLGIAESLTNLGSLESAQGNYRRARTLLEEALKLDRAWGEPRMVAIDLNNLAEVAQHQGETERAESLFSEALIIGRELSEAEVITSCLDGLAQAAQQRGRMERAVCLYAVADALRESAGACVHEDQRVQRERSLAELRASLGATRFDHATRRGKCMAPHDGIAYALTSDVAESSAGR